MANTRLLAQASEADLEKLIYHYAHLRGWRIHIERPARTARGWSTPIKGHAGYPDMTLARRGVVIFAELKSQAGKPTIEQLEWLQEMNGYPTPRDDRDAAGAWIVAAGARHAHGHLAVLWRPQDWPTIEAILR